MYPVNKNYKEEKVRMSSSVAILARWYEYQHEVKFDL